MTLIYATGHLRPVPPGAAVGLAQQPRSPTTGLKQRTSTAMVLSGSVCPVTAPQCPPAAPGCHHPTLATPPIQDSHHFLTGNTIPRTVFLMHRTTPLRRATTSMPKCTDPIGRMSRQARFTGSRHQATVRCIGLKRPLRMTLTSTAATLTVGLSRMIRLMCVTIACARRRQDLVRDRREQRQSFQR